jgi:hypothetical protein
VTRPGYAVCYGAVGQHAGDQKFFASKETH